MPLTDRGKLLLVAAVGFYAAARIFAIDEAAMAAVACVALVVLALIYTRVASARLAIRRHVHPNRLFFDAEADVRLEVRNEGRVPTALLLVEEETPPALADRPRFVLEPLGTGQTTAIGYGLHGRARGRYEVGPATVRLRDPFGIAVRRVRFGRTDEVIVYPPVYRLPNALPRSGRHGTSSEGTARPLATSGEFANVREYVRGDDLRKVHWRSTAHRGKLMIKQEEAPQEAQATLVLDLRRAGHRGTGPASTFEAAVAAGASAAYHLAERGHRLRLVTGLITAPPPTVTWEHVLDELAVVHPQRGATFLPVWQQLAKGTGGDGALVCVVPIPEAAELREMVRAGRNFGSRVAVLVAPASRRDAASASATTAIAALRAAGWRATVHRPGTDLARDWQELALRAERQVVHA